MDGVLIIDKPAGMTSHDVVARVRRIVGERRVGHTGTLDPFATGILVVLVGRATRLAQFLGGSVKEYEAVIRLGFSTDTGDVTGKRLTPVQEKPNPWTNEEIQDALASLRGEIEQVPPMYSAKKIAGRKLYELARRGEEVERKPVRVTIHSLELAGNVGKIFPQNVDGTTDIQIRVTCSAGTYVRTLAEDVGKRLGVGAHVVALRRTRAGNFDLKRAKTLEQLEESMRQGSLDDILVSPDLAIEFLPSVSLTSLEVQRTQQGLPLKLGSKQALREADWVRMRDAAGVLVAVGTYDLEAELVRPRVVL
ncbi:MAG TPA: tRNA pseudouridine(55) synthase TruB [Pyrinomonadaceae bacterium]|jgi:tRNA pseudouridine55 synthase|nr:tRNA pseudouridine(55) synthase TruB [Pyrinomonadaceae bacterium]